MPRRERSRCRWAPGCTESPISGLCCSMRTRMIPTQHSVGGKQLQMLFDEGGRVRRVGGGAHGEQERAARRFFMHGWRSEGACLPRLRMPAGASTRSEEAMQRSTARLRLWLLQRRRVREGQHPEEACQRSAPEDVAQQNCKKGGARNKSSMARPIFHSRPLLESEIFQRESTELLW